MKTTPETKCTSCGASYADVVRGGREYFIPWGSYFLCDKCHRLAIMEASQTDLKLLLEPPK